MNYRKKSTSIKSSNKRGPGFLPLFLFGYYRVCSHACVLVRSYLDYVPQPVNISIIKFNHFKISYVTIKDQN